MDTIEKECKSYHPDMELIGSGNTDYGMYLAEILIKKYGLGNVPDPSLQGDISKAKEIISEHPPREVYNSTKRRQLLIGIFGRLDRDAGFEVGDCNTKSTVDLVNDYMAFRREYLD